MWKIMESSKKIKYHLLRPLQHKSKVLAIQEKENVFISEWRKKPSEF